MKGATSGRGTGARAGMSAVALSRLTWTADDRREWDRMYSRARRVARRRAARERDDAFFRAQERAASVHYVHVDILAEQAVAREVTAILHGAL